MTSQSKEIIHIVCNDISWHIEDELAVNGLPDFSGFSDEDRRRVTEALKNVLLSILDHGEARTL